MVEGGFLVAEIRRVGRALPGESQIFALSECIVLLSHLPGFQGIA